MTSLKRPHDPNSPPPDVWVSHSHESDSDSESESEPEPLPKRSRHEPDSDGFISDASDLEENEGWTRYGGPDQADPIENDTQSEDEDEQNGFMCYDSSRSDDGWFKHACPQEDVDMEDADSDSGNNSDVDMDNSDGEEGFEEYAADSSDNDTLSDDEEHGNDEGMPAFQNKHMRKQYESLLNAPRGSPATKNDLAALYKLFQVPPSQSTPGRSAKSTPRTAPTHRPSTILDLQRLVRDTTRFVMGLASKNTPLTNAHVPSRDEVERFEQTKLVKHGPRISKLKVDVATPKLASLWNEQAIRLLCTYFSDNIILEKPVKAAVLSQMFKTHFQRLRQRYVRATANPGPAQALNFLDAKAKRAETNRLRTLRNQRVKAAELIAETDPMLHKLLPLIKSLPKEAMSGDEADHRQGNARYVVKTLEWRDPDVDPFMGTLDDLHLSTRFNPDGSAGRGKFPHVRIRNTARPPKVVNAPPNLPRNFYAPLWLAKLTEFERRALKMKPTVNLSFSPGVLRHAARFHHIVDGSQHPLDINDPSLPVVPPPARKPHSSAKGKGKQSRGDNGKRPA